MTDANHAKDPTHFMIPECFLQSEDGISLLCSRKQLSIYDMNPPPQTGWEQVLVRRAVDRRTGVVMAEDNVHSVPVEEQGRRLEGNVPKDFMTVFFLLGWRKVVTTH